MKERHQPTVEGTWRALKGWETRRRRKEAQQCLSDKYWNKYERYGCNTYFDDAFGEVMRRIAVIENKGNFIEEDENGKSYDYKNGYNVNYRYTISKDIPPRIVRIQNLDYHEECV